jgi:magnesium transporter
VLWLLVLLVTNTGTSAVIHSQEDILQKMVALNAFIPLLIGTGGNVGAQSSTVVIRSINVDAARHNQPLWVIQREVRAGVLLGLMLGVIVVLWAYALQQNWAVAIAVGLSLVIISGLASLAGSALPYLFKWLKFDPALMSAPFITTAVDVLGVLIYFAIARVIITRF